MSTASTLSGVHRISDQKVRNRLRDAGISARRPVRDVVLNKQYRQNTVSSGHRHTEYDPSSDGEQFGSVMNPDSYYSVQMVELGCTGGEKIVLLRTAAKKPTDLVV
jgi:hypothetical protein